jgi:hypothetical protein
MRVYRIRKWSEIYENNRTREMKLMQWLPLPIKLSGVGYSYLMTLKNGPAVFGCFIALLELAGRCEERGVLLRGAGIPHDVATMARAVRMQPALVAETLKICTSFDCLWMEYEEIGENSQQCGQTAGGVRADCGQSALQERTGQDRTGEEKTGEEPDAQALPPFLESWNHFASNHGLSQIKELTKSRKAKIKVRKFELEEFNRILTAIEKSPFLLGINDRNWKIDFDWIFENDSNALKILEGKYAGNEKRNSDSNRPEFEKAAKGKYANL